MPDAPDYTLLSDVNVVGSVTLDVNVVGSVTINTSITGVESGVTFDVNIASSSVTLEVSITNATVTLNVNITAQDIDLKIYTPSGRWVVGSDLITPAVVSMDTSIDAGTEVELFNLTGRGRIKQIGFHFYQGASGVNLYEYMHLRVYIDGETSPTIDLTPHQIDLLNGLVAIWNINYGINRVTVDSDQYATAVQASTPAGAVTTVRRMQTTAEVTRVGGFIKFDIEFESSASIRVYNAGGGLEYASLVVVYGEYL